MQNCGSVSVNRRTMRTGLRKRKRESSGEIVLADSMFQFLLGAQRREIFLRVKHVFFRARSARNKILSGKTRVFSGAQRPGRFLEVFHVFSSARSAGKVFPRVFFCPESGFCLFSFALFFWFLSSASFLLKLFSFGFPKRKVLFFWCLA